jgi:hypothetical protein
VLSWWYDQRSGVFVHCTARNTSLSSCSKPCTVASFISIFTSLVDLRFANACLSYSWTSRSLLVKVSHALVVWRFFFRLTNLIINQSINQSMIIDQRSTDLYYLTWRNYKSLMLSAFCGRGENRTQYLSACSPTLYPLSYPARFVANISSTMEFVNCATTMNFMAGITFSHTAAALSHGFDNFNLW